MRAVPLSLSSYIVEQAAAASKTFSTKTMFNPIVGTSTWLSLAERLVTGLHWLHSSGQVVHGDIKPQNILLRPRAFCEEDNKTFPFDALFIDFTSSNDVSSDSDSATKALPMSALTPPFAAPELLNVRSLQSADAVPSKASDIFSLAVTLLAAVTGDLLLYPSSSNMQRLAMSRDGHRVIDYVRAGPHCSRVPRKGTVERIVSPAVCKDPTVRIQPTEWLDLIANEISAASAKAS
jgi:serine/threonine protein kinase